MLFGPPNLAKLTTASPLASRRHFLRAYGYLTRTDIDGPAPVYHHTFCDGATSAYPADPLVAKLPGGIVFGTRCRTGQRLGFVSNYVGETPETRFLNDRGEGRWI